jgi:hypothetical protein
MIKHLELNNLYFDNYNKLSVIWILSVIIISILIMIFIPTFFPRTTPVIDVSIDIENSFTCDALIYDLDMFYDYFGICPELNNLRYASLTFTPLHFSISDLDYYFKIIVAKYFNMCNTRRLNQINQNLLFDVAINSTIKTCSFILVECESFSNEACIVFTPECYENKFNLKDIQTYWNITLALLSPALIPNYGYTCLKLVESKDVIGTLIFTISGLSLFYFIIKIIHVIMLSLIKRNHKDKNNDLEEELLSG